MDDALEAVRRWAAAEQDNDAAALDTVLDEEFAGVGPVGFVLGRAMWLDRFAKGLENHAFAVEDPQVRDVGGATVVVGVLVQQTLVKGKDSSGRFRITLVISTREGRHLISHVHIGPLTYPAAQRDI